MHSVWINADRQVDKACKVKSKYKEQEMAMAYRRGLFNFLAPPDKRADALL